MFTGIIVGTGKVTKLDQKTKNRSAIRMTVNLGKYAKGLKIAQRLYKTHLSEEDYAQIMKVATESDVEPYDIKKGTLH